MRDLTPPPPPQKKSSPYLGVSFWFGAILSEKQCPIWLRLHEKTFGKQTFFRGGGAPRPLYSKIFVYPILNPPPPLIEKLDSPRLRVWLFWKFVRSASWTSRVFCQNLMEFLNYWGPCRTAAALIGNFVIFLYVIIILEWQKIPLVCYCCGLVWLRRLFQRESIGNTGRDMHIIMYMYYFRLNRNISQQEKLISSATGASGWTSVADVATINCLCLP